MNKKILLFLCLVFFSLQILHISCTELKDTKKKLNIAIIGAGIGGLSAAHYLKNSQIQNINKIDIFEKNSRLGGRIQTEKIFNRKQNSGASFYIKENKIIVSLIQELELKEIRCTENNLDNFGIYDNNKNFLFSLGHSKAQNTLKMTQRYGNSNQELFSILTKFLENLKKTYEALEKKIFFEKLEDYVKYIKIDELISISFKEYLLKQSLNPLYLDEFVRSFLNIIYNQKIEEINSFAGSIALINSFLPVYEVEGGNDLIINKLAEKLIGKISKNIKSSESYKNIKVKIYKNSEVLKVERKENSKLSLNYKTFDISDKIKNLQKEYDIVILAAPKEQSRINLPIDQSDLQKIDLTPEKDYLYMIKGKLIDNLFHVLNSELPGLLIPHHDSESDNISSITKIGENQFKINSNLPLSNKILRKYFQKDYTVEYIKYWDMACAKFLPVKAENLPKFEISENLFYLNLIEKIGTCMELSMISSSNVVNILENRYSENEKTYDEKNVEF